MLGAAPVTASVVDATVDVRRVVDSAPAGTTTSLYLKVSWLNSPPAKIVFATCAEAHLLAV